MVVPELGLVLEPVLAVLAHDRVFQNRVPEFPESFPSGESSPRSRLDMQRQIGGRRAEMHEEIGELSERMMRIETLIETHLVPASSTRDPAGP